MRYIWANSYRRPIDSLSSGYHKLKALHGGELPFIIGRYTPVYHLTPHVEPVFDCFIHPEDVRAALTQQGLPTLSELMRNRASSIVRAFQSDSSLKTLLVYWSGGLDSTAILATLLTLPEFVELVEQKRVEIALNQSSISEYPEYYADVIKSKGFKVRESNLADYLDPKVLCVDGMWADELFGNYQAENYAATRGLTPASLLPKLLSEQTLHHRVICRFLDRMQELEAAVPTTTLFQRLWWLEFVLAFQDANLRPYYNGSNTRGGEETLASIRRNTAAQWFSHPSFTRWAIARQFKTPFSTYRESKQELRDYIFELTGDAHYVSNKEKVYSQGKLYFNWHNRLKVDGTLQ